jgi:hypothetical protein
MSVGSAGGRSPIGPVPEPETSAPAPAPAPAATPGGPAAPSHPLLRSARDIWASLVHRAPPREPAPAHENLDPSGARRPVALGTNGRFTAHPGTDARTPAEVGEGLHAAGCLIDDTKDNLIDATGMTAEARARLFASLREDMASVRPGRPAPAGLSDLQALQMRSSGATVLLELMTARGTTDAVKRDAFDLYESMLGEETNPLLRDGMALHLDRLRAALPADLGPRIDRVRDVIAPSKPPYDAWFKDGNDTVNVDWSAGSESRADDITGLKKAGFRVVSESWEKTVLEKTYDVNGQKTKFRVSVRPFQSDMYRNVDDPKTQMVVYTGHSDWGRNMRRSLSGVPSTPAGGKDHLVLTDLCVGKGEIQMFKDRFPNAHLVTTYNSSYFIDSSDGTAPDSEGIHAILNTFQGIAARKGYAAIAEDVRRDNPWRADHRSEGIDNNYIFPTDIATRRKVLDEDHDGQADVFDRLVDFNTYDVAEDTAREFQPVQAPRPAKEIVGTKVDFAAQTINRLCLYSQIFETKNSTGQVISDGYFEPGPADKDIFRFTRTKVDGKDAIAMSMNARYAHMSEEALRMAACFEYNRFVAKNDPSWRLGGRETLLSGMVLASHSLETDAGHRDAEVWQEFLRAYHLPAIPRAEVERAKEIEEHYYSGSYASIDELKKKLDRSLLAGLDAPGAGRIG